MSGGFYGSGKRPASGAWGLVATNHPLASAAGVEMLAAGGNAADAAVAALFTLTVVEPMMVGLLGGGLSHVRTPEGAHLVLDGLGMAPGLATPGMYRPLPGAAGLETVGAENAVGAKAVAAGGAVAGWCALLERFGTMALADVMRPAIRHASGGFRASSYLSECAGSVAGDLARDEGLAGVFLPGGVVVRPGERVVQGAAAESLRAIAAGGGGGVTRGRAGGGGWGVHRAGGGNAAGGGPGALPGAGAGAGAGGVPRGGGGGAAAAGQLGRAYRADAEHPERVCAGGDGA